MNLYIVQCFSIESTTTTTADPGLSSTIHLDPKQALTNELSRSTTTTTTTDVCLYPIEIGKKTYHFLKLK